MKLQLLLLIFLSEGVFMAPMGQEDGLEGKEECPEVLVDSIQQEVNEIFLDALEKEAGSFEKIQNAFTFQPNEVKLCIGVEFTIRNKCFDWSDCVPDFNCSNKFSMIWSSIDPFSPSGEFLIPYAVLMWESFGFEWRNTCNVSEEQALRFSLFVPTPTPICGKCEGSEYLRQAFIDLTAQLPFIVNNSVTFGSYGQFRTNMSTFYTSQTLIYATMFTAVTIFTLLPYVQGKIEPQKGKKTKAYFQFWASQAFFLVISIWTVINNSHQMGDLFYCSNSIYSSYMKIGCFAGAVIVILINFANIDLNTPTQCCCCCRGPFRIAVTILAIIITTFFLLVVFISVPSILLIYYLFPVQTLARLPFLANVVLYANSLTALLLCQLERIIFRLMYHIKPKVIDDSIIHCTPDLHRERLRAHKNHYQDKNRYQEHHDCRRFFTICGPKFYPLILQLIGTLALFYFLMTFVYVASDLLNVDRSQFTSKTEVNSLFSLVPTVLLLLFSVYNKNFFVTDDASEKKRSLLEDLDLMNVNTVEDDEGSGNASGSGADKESKNIRANENTPLIQSA